MKNEQNEIPDAERVVIRRAFQAYGFLTKAFSGQESFTLGEFKKIIQKRFGISRNFTTKETLQVLTKHKNEVVILA